MDQLLFISEFYKYITLSKSHTGYLKWSNTKTIGLVSMLKHLFLGKLIIYQFVQVAFVNDQIVMNINYNSKKIFHSRITGLSPSIKSLRTRVDI